MRFIAALFSALTLTAYAVEKDTSMPPESETGEAAYKAKGNRTVSSSVVNSMVRNTGISEEQAQCLLARHRLSQLVKVDSDPEIQALFESCSVDPSIIGSL